MSKIFYSVKACDVLYKLRYILWDGALLGPVTSSKRDVILTFRPKLDIIKKSRILKMFDARHVEYDIYN